MAVGAFVLALVTARFLILAPEASIYVKSSFVTVPVNFKFSAAGKFANAVVRF